jgi:hypothetical protein
MGRSNNNQKVSYRQIKDYYCIAWLITKQEIYTWLYYGLALLGQEQNKIEVNLNQ